MPCVRSKFDVGLTDYTPFDGQFASPVIGGTQWGNTHFRIGRMRALGARARCCAPAPLPRLRRVCRRLQLQRQSRRRDLARQLPHRLRRLRAATFKGGVSALGPSIGGHGTFDHPVTPPPPPPPPAGRSAPRRNTAASAATATTAARSAAATAAARSAAATAAARSTAATAAARSAAAATAARSAAATAAAATTTRRRRHRHRRLHRSSCRG